MNREPFSQTMMDVVKILEKRSTCKRRQVAAVLVNDKGYILSTGYNGSPRKQEHCDVVGCLRDELGIPSGERQEICRAIHAEQNALIQCAMKQTNPEGSTLYCSASPCFICAKMLIQAGVKCIVYLKEYPDKMAWQMLERAGIEMIKFVYTND